MPYKPVAEPQGITVPFYYFQPSAPQMKGIGPAPGPALHPDDAPDRDVRPAFQVCIKAVCTKDALPDCPLLGCERYLSIWWL